MGISSISAHRSMVFADAAERQASVDYVNGCIDAVAQVGTDIVHMLTGPYAQGASRDQSWQWMLESCRQCGEHAVERGVTLAMEPVGFAVVADMKDLQRFLEDMPGHNFCVNLDVAHLPVANEDPPQWIRTLGGRIVHTHIKDARIYDDVEPRVCVFGVELDFECPPLGQGVIDFPAIIQALVEIGYDGYLSVEHSAHVFGYNEEPWDRYEVAGECHRFVMDLLGETASG
jgi:sugar phosphate isomerase/epimerase